MPITETQLDIIITAYLEAGSRGEDMSIHRYMLDQAIRSVLEEV